MSLMLTHDFEDQRGERERRNWTSSTDPHGKTTDGSFPADQEAGCCALSPLSAAAESAETKELCMCVSQTRRHQQQQVHSLLINCVTLILSCRFSLLLLLFLPFLRLTLQLQQQQRERKKFTTKSSDSISIRSRGGESSMESGREEISSRLFAVYSCSFVSCVRSKRDTKKNRRSGAGQFPVIP